MKLGWMQTTLSVWLAFGAMSFVHAQEALPAGSSPGRIRIGFPPSAAYRQVRDAEVNSALLQWAVFRGLPMPVEMVSAVVTLTNIEGLSCESWNALEPTSLQLRSDGEFALVLQGWEVLGKNEAPEATALHRALFSAGSEVPSLVLFQRRRKLDTRDLSRIFDGKPIDVSVEDQPGLKQLKVFRVGQGSQNPLNVVWFSESFHIVLKHVAAKAGTFVADEHPTAFIVLSRSPDGVSARFSYPAKKLTAEGNVRLTVCEKPLVARIP